jgi:predicted PurR-regulated permease PerM
VWAPAAGILLLTGKVAAGLILFAVGLLLIGLIDNVLRPLLVGRETRMPDWLILIAILGGLGAAGVSGFVLGPIAAGLFITVWHMFVEQYGAADDATPPGAAQAELSLADEPGVPGNP